MGSILDRIQSAYTDRERGIEEEIRSKHGAGDLSRKIADASVAEMLESRASQLEYAKQAPKEVVEAAKGMIENLGDRREVLGRLRDMTPEQREELLRVAPGVAQQMGDERGGAVARTLGAIGRGISHGVSQPIMELVGVGGTDEEIEFIRQLDAAASQEMHPYRPGDPWYERGPLQATEMVPWMATTIGGAGAGRSVATKVAGGLTAKAATGGKAAQAVVNAGQRLSSLPTKVRLPALTAGAAGQLAGITAASYPSMYAQELDSLRAAGVEDNAQMRMVASGTAMIASMVEGIVPNPFPGKVSVVDGAVKAARQYLWESAKRAPGELSEEYLQGVASGLGEVVATHLDENAPDTAISESFSRGWKQSKEAALPLAFLMGVPAGVGAGSSALQARRLGQQGDDEAALQAERDAVNEQRRRLGQQQAEQANVPPTAQPREEVIQNGQDVLDGNVQGDQEGLQQQQGGQGQVGTELTEPASRPSEAAASDIVSPEQTAQPAPGAEGGRTSPPSAQDRLDDAFKAAQEAGGFYQGKNDTPESRAKYIAEERRIFNEYVDRGQRVGGFATPARMAFYDELAKERGGTIKWEPNGNPEKDGYSGVFVPSQQQPADQPGTRRLGQPETQKGDKESQPADKESNDSVSPAPVVAPVTTEATPVVSETPDVTPVAPDTAEVQVTGTRRLGQPASDSVSLPAPAATNRVYRETSIERAEEFLPTSNSSSASPFGADQVFVTDNADLALGQGDNQGVLLEFESDGLDLKPNSKPGTQLPGVGNEYSVRSTPSSMRDKLVAVTVRPDAIARPSMRKRFNLFAERMGWDRTENEDGSVTWRRPAAVQQPTDTTAQSPDPDAEFKANLDSAVAKVKSAWGKTITPRDPVTAEEQDQIDFLRSRGKQASFVDGDSTFFGALDESTGVILISGNRDANDIWRTIGHELAHETKLDKIIPVDSAEFVAGRERRLARATSPYRQRLESEPELLDREARADIVGEFMRDKAFRDKLSRENPTLWEKLRDAVLKVVGKWTPRNEAQALVLEELRKKPGPRKLGQPADTAGGNVSTPQPATDTVSPESTAEIPQLEDAELEAMIEAEFDAQTGVKPEPKEPRQPRRLGQSDRVRANPFGSTKSGKEYAAAQKANPGKLIAFRMGDFYELYGDDAKDAAKRLGLTLTSRDKDSENPIPMAGFPHHQIQGYMDKMGGDMVAVEPGEIGKQPAKPKTRLRKAADKTQQGSTREASGENSKSTSKAFAATTAVAPKTSTKRLGKTASDMMPPQVNAEQGQLGNDAVSPDDATPVRQADIVTTWSRLFNVPIKIGGYKANRGKGKVALGVYKHLTEIVRMREGNAFDIIVASHEVGHHIDKKMNLYSGDAKTSKLAELKTADPKRYQKVYAQLQALDYGYPTTRRVDEGIAESVRQIITGTATNAILGPDAVEWVRQQIDSDPVFGPAMRQAVEQAKQYSDQGAINRARMVFGGPPMDLSARERRRSALRKAINAIYSGLVDRRLVLSDFDKDVAASKQLKDGEASVSEMVAVFDGRISAMAAKAIKDGVHTIDGARISDASIAKAQELLEGEETTSEADAYMVARFGLTLPDTYNFGMDRQDAQEYVDWVESDPDRAQRWQEYHRIHSEFFNSLVELEVIDGGLAREEADRIMGANKDLYVPLMREMGDSRLPRRLGGGSQMIELPKRFQRRTESGSGRPVMPIIEQAIRRTRHHYSRVVRQQIHNKIVQQISEREGLAKWIDEIPPGTIVDSATVDQILGQLVAGGFIDEDRAYAFRQSQKLRDGGTLTQHAVNRLADIYGIEQSGDTVSPEDEVLDRLAIEPDLNSVVLFYKPDYRRPNGKYVIKVMQGDQAQLFEVDPQLYETLLGMPEETHTFIVKAADWMNRKFKAGAVGVNTAFLIGNMFTDAGTFAVNSKYVKNHHRATKPWRWAAEYAAAVSLGNPNELVEIFREYGGELHSYYSVDERSLEKTARRLGSKKRIVGARRLYHWLGDGIENTVDYLRVLTAISDVGPRLAEAEGYLRTQGIVIKKGKLVDAETGQPANPSRDQLIKAMHAAASVTYDYRRKGSAIAGIERVAPFTNAAIQALDKTVRTYRQMLTGLGSSEQETRSIANQAFLSLVAMSSIYLIVKSLYMDDEEELDQWERDGYVNFFVPGTNRRYGLRMSREHSWVSNAALAGMRYFIKEDKDAIRDFARQELNNRIPFQASGVVGTTFNTARNYDDFTGRNIEPNHLRSGPSAVSPKYRYDEYTTELSKMLGKNDVVSPMQIDYLLSGYTGGAYKRIAQTGEKLVVPVLQAMGLAEDADVQPWSGRDIPFYRGVVRDNVPNASVDEMYDRMDEVMREINDTEAAGQVPSAALVKESQMIANAATVMKLLREASGPDYDSSENRVAIARDAMEKEHHPSYPHPFYTEIPEEVSATIRKMAFNDLDSLSRDLGRPSKSKDQTDEEYAQEIAVWEAKRDGDRQFWAKHIDSPIVQQALKEVRMSPAFRDTLFGENRPKFDSGKETFREYAEERRRFGQRQEAARNFVKFGQGDSQPVASK